MIRRTGGAALFLVVDVPERALLPAAKGARAVNLRTGEIRGPLDGGCGSGPDVRAIVPAWQGAGTLMVGQRNVRSRWVGMLWIAGP